MSQSNHPVVEKLDQAACRILKYIAYISAFCLFAIMLVAFFNVLGEKLRSAGLPVTGIPASTEIIQYLHIPVVYLAAAFVTLDRGHTRIDLLSVKLPKAVQKFFIILGDLLGIGVCGVIIWRGFVQMGRFIARHRMSSVSGVGFPLWPFALILGIGYILLLLSLILHIVREVSGYQPPPPAGGPPDAPPPMEDEKGPITPPPVTPEERGAIQHIIDEERKNGGKN